MSREIVNEASACTIQTRFFDSNQLAATPGSARYRLKDVTNDRIIRDWTDLIPAPVIAIDIPADDNAIYRNEVTLQEHALTVQADFGTDSQYTAEERYLVRNLEGIRA